MQRDAETNDIELMKRISAGDQHAFTVLMHRHLAGVVNFNKQYLSEEAEDISQEAFIRLWNKAPEWEDKGISPKAWLLRVSYNLCIDTLRKRKTVSLGHAAHALDIAANIAAQSNETESDFQQKIATLDRLPERQRSAITLCAYNGLNNKAAAKVMNISVDALESLLARGRRKLRHLLNETADD